MFETIKNRKIKFALVGCGRISNNHFGSFETLADECEIIGVCDTDPANLQAAVERCGLAWDEALFAPYFDPARIHCEDQGGNHPVERIYEQLLEWC